MSDVNEALKSLASTYVEALKQQMGERLVAAVLFGSVARGEAGSYSDIDLLLVLEGLPRGRLERQKVLEEADWRVEPELQALRARGIYADISPVLKTPEEAAHIVPLYLDMVEDAIILYEREGFFSTVLQRLAESLRRLGAQRVQRGKLRYWILKPDYRPGEIFEI